MLGPAPVFDGHGVLVLAHTAAWQVAMLEGAAGTAVTEPLRAAASGLSARLGWRADTPVTRAEP